MQSKLQMYREGLNKYNLAKQVTKWYRECYRDNVLDKIGNSVVHTKYEMRSGMNMTMGKNWNFIKYLARALLAFKAIIERHYMITIN